MNVYVHFPFCRSKCTYCALHSRAGSTGQARTEYVKHLTEELAALDIAPHSIETVYFGGGSPALCDLRPMTEALRRLTAPSCEFTVELHPLDVSDDTLFMLEDGGVNRISMGVQSLDDATLRHMRRGYTALEAERAFAKIRRRFENAGIDLIVGYPGDSSGTAELARLGSWGLAHCSVYSLILESGSILAKQAQNLSFPTDDETLDKIRDVAALLRSIGLERYEISNYARPGRECAHNMAVWRGEDYIGLGEGAHGRRGLQRTESGNIETVTPEQDETERRIFRLRTIEGVDASNRPDWIHALDGFAAQGLVTKHGGVYRLTERGTEVCDSILLALV